MKRHCWSIVLALVLLAPTLASACPMCKDSIPESDAPQRTSLPGGFNTSVYYMLTGLLMTLGLVTGVITKGVRSTNARMNQHLDNDPKM